MLDSKPTIHLNGTSAEALLDGYADACAALLASERALAACAPNARDYYVQGPEAFALAQQRHYQRADRLQSVRTELAMLAEHCQEQIDLRNSRRVSR
jgi:hypothetical protein